MEFEIYLDPDLPAYGSLQELQDTNNNAEQFPVFISIDVEPVPLSPSEVEIRLNSFFEDLNPQTFRAPQTYPRPCADTEQNCPQKQRRSSVITTLKEASEGISIQSQQIQSKEFENIYPKETCQVLPMDLSVVTPHIASVDSPFQVIHAF